MVGDDLGQDVYNTDKEYMEQLLSGLTVYNSANLSFFRRKLNQTKKNKIQEKLERTEIEKAVHENLGQDEGNILDQILHERKQKHQFPKGIKRVDLDDNLF